MAMAPGRFSPHSTKLLRGMGESFATLLRRHRVEAGLSQQALAERAGLSVDAIGTLERGARRAPYTYTLDLLIAALDLDGDARHQFTEAAKSARTGKPRPLRHAAPKNLPQPLTSLIGRTGDVDAVLTLLERCKLVTIAGSGGIGKTRIAIEVGRRYAERESRDVAFVDLSSVTEDSLVADAISSALGTPDAQVAHRADTLAQYVGSKPLLLILDTCEHRIDEVASLSSMLLQHCTGTVILSTSREPLGISGETIFRLPSLTFPERGNPKADDAGSYSALELFAERAKAVDPTFAIAEDNAPLVADVCRHLEGIPLAIELAAARLTSFGLATLRARVSESMMLKSSLRGVPDRQATMQATVAWSYDLLSETQRILLNRLAIFVGSFSLEAAERVCASEYLGSAEIPILLASLVDKSLVSASLDTPTVRYRILDSVRAYAIQQLEIKDNPDALYRNRAAWLLEKVSELSFADGDNVRAAIRWALASHNEEDVVNAGRIAGGFRVLLLRSRNLPEYRLWCESLVNRIDHDRFPDVVAPVFAGFIQASPAIDKLSPIQRAIPLFERISDFGGLAHLYAELAFCLLGLGRLDEGEAAARDALATCERHGLDCSAAAVHSLGALARVANARRRTDEARAYLSRALQTATRARCDEHWQSYLRQLLSGIEFAEGNVARAIELTEEALHLDGDTPGRSHGEQVATLSTYRLFQGQIDEAAALAREVVVDWRERISALDSIACLAAISAIRGQSATAARVAGFLQVAFARRETWRGSTIDHAIDDLLERKLRESLPEDELDRLKAEGADLTLDRAIDEVFRATEPASE